MRGRCWLSCLANDHLVLFANPEFVVFVGTTIEFEALPDDITVHQMREIFPFTSGSTTADLFLSVTLEGTALFSVSQEHLSAIRKSAFADDSNTFDSSKLFASLDRTASFM